MITNDYLLRELNQQRRAQVAEAVAGLRAGGDRRRLRINPLRRRTLTAASPSTGAVVVHSGSSDLRIAANRA